MKKLNLPSELHVITLSELTSSLDEPMNQPLSICYGDVMIMDYKKVG